MICISSYIDFVVGGCIAVALYIAVVDPLLLSFGRWLCG